MEFTSRYYSANAPTVQSSSGRCLSLFPERGNDAGVRAFSFKSLAVARNRVTEKEISEGCEQISFDAESGPGRLAERNFNRRQKIEESDDHDKGSVFEEANESIDHRRDCNLERLGQDDVRGPLPII
jgi:hypothetical protein